MVLALMLYTRNHFPFASGKSSELLLYDSRDHRVVDAAKQRQ